MIKTNMNAKNQQIKTNIIAKKNAKYTHNCSETDQLF